MDHLLTSQSIGISELREAPAKAFEHARDEAIVVLNHNRPAGYIVSSQWMERVLDQLADRAVAQKAVSRLDTLATARRVDPRSL